MNIKRPLLPGFLKKAEHKLLLNKPALWSSRVHLVLYYGCLFILALTAICFLNTNDLRASSTVPYWVEGVSIVSVIALTIWLIYLLRFNVFKKYGAQGTLSPLSTFILYFISVGVIVLFNYVPIVAESIRANMAYSDEEIVNDVNAINIKVAQLEYKSLQFRWPHDTVEVVDNDDVLVDSSRPATDNEEEEIVAPVRLHDYRYVDTAHFRSSLEQVDSVRKIGANVYILYNTPSFMFVRSYHKGEPAKKKLLNEFDIYNKVLKGPAPSINRHQVIDELNVLLNKYYYPGPDINPNAIETSVDDSPLERIKKKYHLGYIEDGTDNIESKKYFWSDDKLNVLVRLFYYVTLAISLLLFIFRHTTVRIFFLSLLTALLLGIFSALILSFTRASERTFFIWMFCYAVLFFLLSLTTWFSKTRNAIAGIFTNLFVVAVPLFPFVCLGYYYEWRKQQAREHDAPWPDVESFLLYFEVGGALLLLILLATYIGKTYRRWYSLPED